MAERNPMPELFQLDTRSLEALLRAVMGSGEGINVDKIRAVAAGFLRHAAKEVVGVIHIGGVGVGGSTVGHALQITVGQAAVGVVDQLDIAARNGCGGIVVAADVDTGGITEAVCRELAGTRKGDGNAIPFVWNSVDFVK